MDEETRDPGEIIVEGEIAPGLKCTKPYVSLDGEMNDPGVILGASHFVGDTCLSAGASAREVSAVCRGAFGSFCHVFVVSVARSLSRHG